MLFSHPTMCQGQQEGPGIESLQAFANVTYYISFLCSLLLSPWCSYWSSTIGAWHDFIFCGKLMRVGIFAFGNQTANMSILKCTALFLGIWNVDKLTRGMREKNDRKHEHKHKKSAVTLPNQWQLSFCSWQRLAKTLLLVNISFFYCTFLSLIEFVHLPYHRCCCYLPVILIVLTVQVSVYPC